MARIPHDSRVGTLEAIVKREAISQPNAASFPSHIRRVVMEALIIPDYAPTAAPSPVFSRPRTDGSGGSGAQVSLDSTLGLDIVSGIVVFVVAEWRGRLSVN